MKWRHALCLLTFILIYICAKSSLETDLKKSRSLKAILNAENKKLMTDDDEDSDGKQLLHGPLQKHRPLTAGDTFTPQEMLPIATKLLQKVGEPGHGRGFISSTRYPEELADKLFEAFFATTKRIIILKDGDISGIDALQALALSGEVAEETQEEEDPESLSTVYLRGQLVKVKNEPKKSKFNLVTKTAGGLDEMKRRGVPLAKKLNRERHLIINKRRGNEKKGKENDKNDNIDVRREKADKNKKRKEQPTKRSQKDPPKCRWRYVCENATNLDSCQLHTNCIKENSKQTIDDISVKHKKDEHNLEIMQFRKMLGLSIIDEEVEKILETRNLYLKTANEDAIKKVESLSEYFNNIMVMNVYETTTAKSRGMFTDKQKNSHLYREESNKNNDMSHTKDL
ncbi:uncharacterized protein LOC126780765 isoform X1 [Nymphalis io]|uniref:uncharacterized protein LOC126780765 isoform X1 n=1 Tax=Inachis io TaxID=171585 RepID=UPI00216A6BA0|nr:uncharacterized protein LOC126780765 isoform X1 [Nymphalis io]